MRNLPNLDHRQLPQKRETHGIPEIHSMKSSNKSTKYAVAILPVDNQNVLSEKYNDEKLAITLLTVGTGSTAYHF